MVASVGFGKPTARSFLASTTKRCAASKVLAAWTSTLCLPSGSVTVTVHKRIDIRLALGEQKTKIQGTYRSGTHRGRIYRALRDCRLLLISVTRPSVFRVA